MSTTIDYSTARIECPHCGASVDVDVTIMQDNRTCEIDTSYAQKAYCTECEKSFKVTKKMVA